MKKSKRIFIIFLLIIILTACGVKNSSDETAFETLYNNSENIKKTAQEMFIKEMKTREYKDYDIQETAYGFFLSNKEPIYMVVFKYKLNSNIKYYGYKFLVENNNYSLIEEGDNLNIYILNS